MDILLEPVKTEQWTVVLVGNFVDILVELVGLVELA